MLLVQQYLETHSFGDLAREHGVYASLSKSGHKWSLNYDQIEAKEADPLAQECRGLILACHDGRVLSADNRDQIVPGKTKILAFPMKRFFNHGQGSAANINWSDPKLAVLEKLDGTLCIVYYDHFTNQWCVATRSVSEADLPMDNGVFTFRTLFEKALQETCGLSFQEYTSKLDPEITYCFELTTPYNRIVVYYPNSKITLLAAREVLYETDQWGTKCVSLNELEISSIDSFGVPKVHAYSPKTIEELVNWVSSLNPMEHEGVVVRDSNFNRIKVKNAAYVAYNKVRDAVASSPRNMVELILSEKDDDVITMLPEDLANNLKHIKEGLQKGIMKYDSDYHLMMLNLKALGEEKNKKSFALRVQNHKHMWSAPFFQMFDGKASSMKDFIMKNKKNGTWSDSFLDKVLEISKIPEA